MNAVNCAEHLIELTSTTPVRQRPRRFSPAQNTEAKRITDELLELGMVRRSHSPYASPIVLVKKKNGKTRICMDYRALNAVTVPDNFPLPRIDTILDSLTGKSWFASLDLQSGYWQIPIRPEDQPKTAFVTEDGLFEWKRMPFGLRNAPSSFMKVMNQVMSHLPKGIALAYLDDIIIAGATFEELNANAEAVLIAFRQAGLKFNVDKCEFFKREVQFLGHVLNAKGISVDPAKIKTIEAWRRPTCRKDVQSFLGFCNYYRRFIARFAGLATPLVALVSPYVRWTWDQAQEESFQAMKYALCHTITLAFPEPDANLILDTDASDKGLGAVLSQVNANKGMVEEAPISFWSKSLGATGQRYCTTRKELLAVVCGIEAHRTYLHGRPFVVRSDHTALRYMLAKSSQFTDPLVVRLMDRLTPFNFELQYRAGTDHGNADGASRGGVCTDPCNFCDKKINHAYDLHSDELDSEDLLLDPTWMTPEELETTAIKDIIRRGYDENAKAGLKQKASLVRRAVDACAQRRNATSPGGLVGGGAAVVTTQDLLGDSLAYAQLADQEADRLFVDHLDALAEDRGDEEAADASDDPEPLDWGPHQLDEAELVHQSIKLTDYWTDPNLQATALRAQQEADINIRDLLALKLAGAIEPMGRDKKHLGLRGIKLYKEYDNLFVGLECVLMRKQPYSFHPDGRMQYFAQVVLPTSLVPRILTLYHSGGLSGHLGSLKLYEKIIRSFYWGPRSQMMDDIEKFVSECEVCQMRNKAGERTRPPIRPRPAGYFMQQVQIDLIGHLAKATRPGDNNVYQYCLMIGERVSRFFLAVPLVNKRADTIARALFDNFISIFGTPTEIFSDNGTEFAVQRELAKLMGFDTSTCNAYHPKANGMVERYNQTFKNFMKVFLHPTPGSYTAFQPSDWIHYVKAAQMAYNNSVHSRLKAAPAEIVFGHLPRSPVNLCSGIDETAALRPEFAGYSHAYTRELRDVMNEVREQARRNLEQSASRVALQSDHSATNFRTYQVGDAVLLWRPSRQMRLAWTGPFTVVRRVSSLSYHVQMTATRKPKRVAVEDLKPYTGPDPPNWLHPRFVKRGPGQTAETLIPQEMWVPSNEPHFMPCGPERDEAPALAASPSSWPEGLAVNDPRPALARPPWPITRGSPPFRWPNLTTF
jgi:hypothetical protein